MYINGEWEKLQVFDSQYIHDVMQCNARKARTNERIKWIKRKIPVEQRTWLTTRKTIEWSMHTTHQTFYPFYPLFSLFIQHIWMKTITYLCIWRSHSTYSQHTHTSFIHAHTHSPHIPINVCLHSLITWFRTILNFFNGVFFSFLSFTLSHHCTWSIFVVVDVFKYQCYVFTSYTCSMFICFKPIGI